jgi:hypothetical protein
MPLCPLISCHHLEADAVLEWEGIFLFGFLWARLGEGMKMDPRPCQCLQGQALRHAGMTELE